MQLDIVPLIARSVEMASVKMAGSKNLFDVSKKEPFEKYYTVHEELGRYNLAAI